MNKVIVRLLFVCGFLLCILALAAATGTIQQRLFPPIRFLFGPVDMVYVNTNAIPFSYANELVHTYTLTDFVLDKEIIYPTAKIWCRSADGDQAYTDVFNVKDGFSRLLILPEPLTPEEMTNIAGPAIFSAGPLDMRIHVYGWRAVNGKIGDSFEAVAVFSGYIGSNCVFRSLSHCRGEQPM